MDGKELTAAIGNCDNVTQILNTQHDRLFADHVLARLKACDTYGFMRIVRNCNGAHIHPLICEHLLERIICEYAAASCKLVSLGLNIIDTEKIANIALEEMVNMPSAHSAVSDNNSILFHNKKPLDCRRAAVLPYHK